MTPPTLAEVERQQRYSFAAELCSDRHVLLLVARADEGNDSVAQLLADAATGLDCAEVSEFLANPGSEKHDVIVCVDDIGDVESALLARLRERAAAGTQVLIALPGHVARGASSRIPEATAVHQHALEMAWLTGPAPDDELSVPAPEPDPHAARWVILALGFDTTAVGTAGGRVGAAASPIHFGYLTALEAAHAELRRVNARLAATPTGKQGSAAAALQAEVRRLQEHIAWHEERLAQEVENARLNDEMLQRARAALQTPRHRAVESLRYHLLRIPLAGRILQLLWRVVGRVFKPAS